MIPKRIITVWLSEGQMPPLIKKCFQSVSEFAMRFGYEHKLVSLNNYPKGIKYLDECIAAKKWAKAADFLRIYYLHRIGGIYLDADVEMIEGETFDDLLHYDLFCGREENNFISNAIIGAASSNTLLWQYLKTVQENFIGSGDLVFQPGMYLWTELVHEAERTDKYGRKVKVFPPEFFLPYNHHMDRLLLTPNSRCIHHFSRSWKK